MDPVTQRRTNSSTKSAKGRNAQAEAVEVGENGDKPMKAASLAMWRTGADVVVDKSKSIESLVAGMQPAVVAESRRKAHMRMRTGLLKEIVTQTEAGKASA